MASTPPPPLPTVPAMTGDSMNNATIIGIVLGGAAAVLLFVGVIVCCVLRSRRKNEQKQMRGSSYAHQSKHGHDNPTTNITGVVPYSAGNGPVPKIVSSVEPSGTGDGSNNPVVLNASSLNNTNTGGVDDNGTGRVVLNEHNQSSHPPADVNVPQAPVRYVPPAATHGQVNISPAQTEVLNNTPYVAPAGPIVPQQATLLYPTLPAPATTNLYPSANPVANPAYLTYAPVPVHHANPMIPQTSGLLNPTGHPGQLTLSGAAITGNMQPTSTGTTRDGFTIFQSPHPHGY